LGELDGWDRGELKDIVGPADSQNCGGQFTVASRQVACASQDTTGHKMPVLALTGLVLNPWAAPPIVSSDGVLLILILKARREV
jgi:hypothetical protein